MKVTVNVIILMHSMVMEILRLAVMISVVHVEKNRMLISVYMTKVKIVGNMLLIMLAKETTAVLMKMEM